MIRRMSVLAAAALVAVPSTASAATLGQDFFGLHVQSLGNGGSPSISAGAIRLWDSGTRWDQIEPKRGKYKWAPLDNAVAGAQKAGATEILYVLGSTPKWAASGSSSTDLYGPGTSSLPKKNSYYLDFAKAVAQRYEGRITSFQIWNEANTRSFYNGGKYDGWIKLAALTKQASKAIRSIDADAKIVAASSTVIPDSTFPNESFFYRYLRELKKQKAKVDALSVHLYPVNPNQGPDARVKSIAAVRKVMKKVGLNKPLWDTEVNYGDQRDPAKKVIPSPDKAATYVSRTYLDSARYGIERTFWYGWDINNVLGIAMTNPDGSPTSAGQAFLKTRQWMTAGSWKGCKQSGKVTTCKVGSSKIMWASKATTVKIPATATLDCILTCPASGSGSVKLKAAPIRVS